MDFSLKDLIAHIEKRAEPGLMKFDEGGEIALLPGANGYALASLEPFRAELRDAPKRIEGGAVAGTLEAFVALTNRHKSGDSAIFGDFGSAPSLTAVIDYHTLDHKPRFAKHRIKYGFPLSEEWKAWSAQNGKPMGQAEWAAFIEDRIADLVSPSDEERATFGELFQTTLATPADLVTLARGLSVAVEAKVVDSRVLQSGESQIAFEETHRDGAGQKLKVPGLFVVRAPLFVGAEPSRLLARLCYRVKDGRVLWFYQLYRADEAVREALRAALTAAGAETGLPIYEATPEI